MAQLSRSWIGTSTDIGIRSGAIPRPPVSTCVPGETLGIVGESGSSKTMAPCPPRSAPQGLSPPARSFWTDGTNKLPLKEAQAARHEG